MTIAAVITFLGIIVAVSPLSLVVMIGVPALIRRPLADDTNVRLVQIATILGLVAALGMLGIMLSTGLRHVPVEIGHWVTIPGYHLNLRFIFDRLSVPLVVLTFLLCGVISAFVSRYMHREAGANRFHVCYALFLAGMTFASAAATIETLFLGWELVGLSSAMLVAFYHQRTGPVRNGLRVWAIYRVSDAALLMASIALHHLHGEGDLTIALGQNWPDGSSVLTPTQSLWVGLLILLAAMGKSALIPFSGWLPRAMEGPTPSSAIFYGALSVHLGAYLLLRASSLLDQSPLLAALVTIIGLVTAAYAALVARVQTDIKSALSFASLTQVGLIVAEIGIGFRYLALIHLLGHACLRTLQFLRAPALLGDRQSLENALGRRLAPAAELSAAQIARSLAWYRWAFERGFLDQSLDRFVVEPVLGVFRWCDRQERRWVKFLEGEDEFTGTVAERQPIAAAPSLEDIP
jgi:NAD(P)H-quinone oxidoreductase subunit 5